MRIRRIAAFYCFGLLLVLGALSPTPLIAVNQSILENPNTNPFSKSEYDEDDDDDDHEEELDDDDSSVGVEFLSPGSGLQPDSRAKIKIELEMDGELEFEIDVRGIPAGNYMLFVGGIDRGILTVFAHGNATRGVAEFETFPDDSEERVLDFDPRGQLVEIRMGSSVFFSGVAPTVASPGDVPDSSEPEIRYSAEDGSAEVDVYLGKHSDNPIPGYVEVSLEQELDGELEFEIVARNLPTGSYDLVVDGVKRGDLIVAQRGNATYGELQFESSPDNPAELLLDFEVAAKRVEIQQDGTTYFSGIISMLVANPSTPLPSKLGYRSVPTALLPNATASVLSNGFKQSTWFGVYDDTHFPVLIHCVLGRVEFRFTDGRNLLVSSSFGVLEIVESLAGPVTYHLFSYESGRIYTLGATDAECSLLESGGLETEDGFVKGVLPDPTDTLGFYHLAFEATVETQEKSVATIQEVQEGDLREAREELLETELYRTIAVNNANRTIQAAQITGIDTAFWTAAANDLITIADQALIAAQQAVSTAE